MYRKTVQDIIHVNGSKTRPGYTLNDIANALGLDAENTIDYTVALGTVAGFKAEAFDDLPDYYTNAGEEIRGYKLDNLDANLGSDESVEKIDESSIGNNETGEDSDDTKFQRGNHPNSRANLKPFPKGVSGNPSGRPQKFEVLKRVLNEYGNEETLDWNGESEGTRREQVWKTIWRHAIMGDMKYVQLLAQLGCLDD